ncbi:MAG: xanthine dehydrogenase family protein molybdopterin-binding subunit [Nitrososphaerales archaeon]
MSSTIQISSDSTSIKQSLEGSMIPRIDAYERASGLAKYATDWKMPGMLYARILQSTIPHGIVKHIDSAKAQSLIGVRAIVTCFDDRTVWRVGDRDHDKYVFTERVRYVGDCIGAVAADSRFLAQRGVDLIQVEYDELPAVFNIDDATRPDAPKLWGDGNVIGPLKYGFGDIDDSFKKADMVFERKYSTSRVHSAPLEPAASLAWWDESLTNLTVVAATQSIHGCREGLSADLNIPIKNIRIISLYKGGGFGNKASSMNYDLTAVILAKITRKPVMVEYSREQDFNNVHGRWSTNQSLAAAIDKRQSKILGMKLVNQSDVGSYLRGIKNKNENMFVNGSENYYACESWQAEVCGIYTNSPPTGNMRAPTGPQGCFATETLVDEIAHELEADPLEFRLKNAVEKYHGGSKEFLSNSLKDCLKIGAREFGWTTKWRRPNQMVLPDIRERATGIGVAMTAWHAYVGKGEAWIRLKNDGRVEVCVGVVDIGTGAKTVMAMIAADVLGVELGGVDVMWGDTEKTPYSIGESGSKTTSFTGTAVKNVALKLRKKIISLAAVRLQVNENSLEIRKGIISSSKGSIGFRELLESAALNEIVEKQTTEPVLPDKKVRYSFAAHFAEVEVDVETGEVKIVRYHATHESGDIINKLTAESQVQGGIVMGIGMALSERVLIDQNYGMMQNPSFVTYRPPSNPMIPRIDVSFVNSSDQFGPKSLGEVSIIPVAAAVGNAIFNATGIRLRKTPFDPESLLNAIQENLPKN